MNLIGVLPMMYCQVPDLSPYVGQYLPILSIQ